MEDRDLAGLEVLIFLVAAGMLLLFSLLYFLFRDFLFGSRVGHPVVIWRLNGRVGYQRPLPLPRRVIDFGFWTSFSWAAKADPTISILNLLFCF